MSDPKQIDPPCRWRQKERADGRFGCSSPKLVVRNGVALSHCLKCYCRDHEPPPIKGVGDLAAAAFRQVGLAGNSPDCGCRARKEALNRWLSWRK